VGADSAGRWLAARRRGGGGRCSGCGWSSGSCDSWQLTLCGCRRLRCSRLLGWSSAACRQLPGNRLQALGLAQHSAAAGGGARHWLRLLLIQLLARYLHGSNRRRGLGQALLLLRGGAGRGAGTVGA
jgi:hypothetical protein